MWNQAFQQTEAILLSVQLAQKVSLELPIVVDLVFPHPCFPASPNGLPAVCLFEGSLQRTSACSCSHDTFYNRLKLAERDSGAVLVETMMVTLLH
jgi:hypothetical protein